MHIEKKTLRNVFIGVIICIVLYWILHETERVKVVFGFIRSIVAPFVLGAALAFILNVPMRSIEGTLKRIKKPGVRRCVALILTFLLVLLIITLVCLLLIPQLTETVDSLVPKLSAFATKSEDWVKDFLGEHPELMEWLKKNTGIETMEFSTLVEKGISMLGSGVSVIVGTTFSAIGSITDAFVNVFIAIVFSVYCLFQKETLCRQGRKLAYVFLPEKVADYVIRVMRLTNSTFSDFISGQCIDVCILGAMFAVTMSIFRLPYMPLVSVLVAVTAFIPVVGAWVGCILGAFLILVSNPIQAIWFVVLFLVLQMIENNLIYPRVVGNSIGLNGMWVLVAIAFGGELMGVAGMFIMIPIASVLYTMLSEFVNKTLLTKNIDPEKLKGQPPEPRTRNRKKLIAKKNTKKQDVESEDI